MPEQLQRILETLIKIGEDLDKVLAEHREAKEEG